MNWKLVFLAFALAGCDGGGGSAGSPPFGRGSAAPGAPAPSPGPAPSPSPAPSPGPAPTSAAGFWAGSTSTGLDFNLLIEADGTAWGIYGANGEAFGALNGRLQGAAGSLSGTGTDYFIRGGRTYAISVQAQYTATSINGSYAGDNPGSFQGTFDSSSSAPGVLADITGAWTLVGITAVTTERTTLQIAADGTFTGSNVACSIAGTLTPAAQNYFRFSASFSGTACRFGGRSLSGVAVPYVQRGSRTLGVAGLLADGTDGFIGTGTR